MKHMHILLFGYMLSTLASELLTHQKVSEKLINTSKEFRQNVNECFEEICNNELLFFEHKHNTNIYELLKERLQAYLSTASDSGVYVVSATITKKNPIRFSNDTLHIYAAEIISKCKKNNLQNITVDRFGYIFECWKMVSESDYIKLSNACKKALLVYIDGSSPEYNFYDIYHNFLVPDNNIWFDDEPLIVITLQKSSGSCQLLDVNEMSEQLTFSVDQRSDVCLIKIGDRRETLVVEGLGAHNIIFADMIAIENNNSKKEVLKTELKWKDTTKWRDLHEYILYCYTEDVAQCSVEKQIRSQYFGLNYNKIIKQESLFVKKSDLIAFYIFFTSFLVENPSYDEEKLLGKETYKYEVLVMARKNEQYSKHLYAFKYPVKDADGDYPIVDFDKDSMYYKRMMREHKQMRNMLDILHSVYVNDSQFNYIRVLEIQNILKTKFDWFPQTRFLVERFEFKQVFDAYHNKNNELITNLESKFGTAISLRLFAASFDHEDHIFSCHNLDTIKNLAHGVILHKEIDLSEYKTNPEHYKSDVLILITVGHRTKNEVSYFFLQKKDDSRIISSLKSSNSFVCDAKAEKCIKTSMENIYFSDIPSLIIGFENDIGLPIEDPMEEHIKTIGLAMLNYIKEDYVGFQLFDDSFCQKALFFAKKELLKMKGSELANRGFLTTPIYKTIIKKITKDNGESFTIQKTPNVEFIEDKIKHIYNLDLFENLLLEYNSSLIYKALCKIYLEVLEYLHREYVKKLESNESGYKNDFCFVFLQHNNITDDEEITKKIQSVIKDTFTAV